MPAMAGDGASDVGVAPLAKARIFRPATFRELRNWEKDDALAAFAVFKAGARAMIEGRGPLRPAQAPSASLVEISRAALSQDPRGAFEARAFFEAHFEPFEIFPEANAETNERPFFTGYFEPMTEGSRERSAKFQAPILGRPADLVTLPQGEHLEDCDMPLTSARREGERFLPFPDRAAIEEGALEGQGLELIWLKDRVEVFVVQVQGSAQVTFADGHRVRLRYDGSNGWPYTSIGRLLIEAGAIASHEMSLEALTGWLRAHSEKAKSLMHRNRSYVFFALEDALRPEDGPIGGAGIPLTAGRSLAIDRDVWSYGLPFWVDVARAASDGGRDRWERLMVAQDTGTAIVGAGRIDLFIGSGAAAGAVAGRQRHHGRLFVLLPRGEAPARS
ncbi:MAG: MltA domain-containing protein [Hyphomicrobiales bacterium]|nr:MltA domain-containing protein [Hyphomicrobiales bacterium]